MDNGKKKKENIHDIFLNGEEILKQICSLNDTASSLGGQIQYGGRKTDLLTLQRVTGFSFCIRGSDSSIANSSLSYIDISAYLITTLT